jgi:hypothetical protein
MRDTASETLALPFEESASSFSYPITNNSFLPIAFIRGLVYSSNGPLGTKVPAQEKPHLHILRFGFHA